MINLSVERDAARSSGIHLSTIIKDRLMTAGIVRAAKKQSGNESLDRHMFFNQGFLWERLVEEYIASVENQMIEWDHFVAKGLQPLIEDEIRAAGGALVRPGEQCLDGIYLTPDAINQRLWFYEEWKATAIRAKGFDIQKRKPEWLWQGAANCKVFGMTRAVYRIWHYSSFPPEVSQLVVDWSTEEIDNEWAMMLDHWKYMQERKG